MRLLTALSLFLPLAVPLPGIAQDIDYSTRIENAIEGYIRPAVDGFAEEALDFPQAVASVCDHPSANSRAAFDAEFDRIIDRFAEISFLRFGPLVEDNRLNRLAFLPDPRGVAQRQIRKLRSDSDLLSLTREDLQQKSVALQGITAMELIAYDTSANVTLGTDTPEGRADCAYAMAIAENIAEIGEELSDAWHDPKGYSADLLDPGPDHPTFRTSAEVMETVFNALPVAIVILKDQHVLPVTGGGPEKAKPAALPFSRSGHGITYLASSIAAIDDMIHAMDLVPLLSGPDKRLPGGISFETRNGLSVLDRIETPVRTRFEETGGYQDLSVFVFTLNSMQNILAGQLAPALSLAGGFNALDGD
ncbi:hypothetical protein GCM10011316_09090 [Roseibium aquae]|uniref:Imelysin-like domain-containing protein n=1 Tax=Roseibium aquae TaxID=1323746 RepID=A0A916TDH0_9HYPH|nr:imelysin family protein [Roseibium aquae]GGB39237.1 hypothetical protein GCM10011316_09090 [Roseibium aquae]